MELERSCNSDSSRLPLRSSDIISSPAPMGWKPVFWSKLEVSKLPGLLAQYGRNFSKIADFFKTKTTEDVEERFRTLVDSGRQDLAELVSNADARLREQQGEEDAILLDTNTSDLTMFSANPESGTDAD